MMFDVVYWIILSLDMASLSYEECNDQSGIRNNGKFIEQQSNC